MSDKNSTFELLYSINCNEYTEKKNNLTYLSWASALAEVKKLFPEADFITLKDKETGCSYFKSGTGAEVRLYGWLTNEERNWYFSLPEDIRNQYSHSLPIMDFRNQGIAYENISSTDVNKTIQRAMAKEWAYKGLGLYIYKGEDLPEGVEKEVVKATKTQIDKIEELYDVINIAKILQYYKVESILDLSVEQADQVIRNKK